MKNIGMLGGTFDPPHRGHLRMAAAAERAFGLERVCVVPAAHPWHKRPPEAGFEDRFAMLALALAGHPRWQPLAGPAGQPATYSVDQVAWLRRKLPGARIHFIVGADSFATLPSWKQPERLLRLCDCVVLARDGVAWAGVLAALPAGMLRRLETGDAGPIARLRGGGAVHWLANFHCGISSTEVRRWLAAASPRGASPVPAGVAEYARRAGLYRALRKP